MEKLKKTKNKNHISIGKQSFPEFNKDSVYLEFLADIKKRYQIAQLKAAQVVNQELIQFYWHLGKQIVEKQAQAIWGSKFLEQLSRDLQIGFPGSSGMSVRNLKFMRQFAQLYPDEIGKQPVSQLPWGHIIVLMQRIKDPEIRHWYASNTIQNGISRSVLLMQIETGLYERQGRLDHKTSNYLKKLPPPQSDMAHEMLKDPYKLDFLSVRDEAHEKELEHALIHHIRDFLIELGQGFAFVGSQVPVTINSKNYFIDMLFYHLKLRCYIVVELKVVDFEPEFAGKLGFYLAAIDNILRHPADHKTIGLLLCKSKDKIVAEYALQNIDAPIGVSEFILSKALPKELKDNLPPIEELEAELSASENE
ncbi:MAG TPA: PDDEXK nuclease domain-containing protein [Gammaproteobacteria bacterium]|nr:PDDEXK nuclease domain-containing protein [Gammaproteobacteria bacterium]